MQTHTHVTCARSSQTNRRWARPMRSCYCCCRAISVTKMRMRRRCVRPSPRSYVWAASVVEHQTHTSIGDTSVTKKKKNIVIVNASRVQRTLAYIHRMRALVVLLEFNVSRCVLVRRTYVVVVVVFFQSFLSFVLFALSCAPMRCGGKRIELVSRARFMRIQNGR